LHPPSQRREERRIRAEAESCLERVGLQDWA
jgi:branched-chain amino acid transport system ATP-binding protein